MFSSGHWQSNNFRRCAHHQQDQPWRAIIARLRGLGYHIHICKLERSEADHRAIRGSLPVDSVSAHITSRVHVQPDTFAEKLPVPLPPTTLVPEDNVGLLSLLYTKPRSVTAAPPPDSTLPEYSARLLVTSNTERSERRADRPHLDRGRKPNR